MDDLVHHAIKETRHAALRVQMQESARSTRKKSRSSPTWRSRSARTAEARWSASSPPRPSPSKAAAGSRTVTEASSQHPPAKREQERLRQIVRAVPRSSASSSKGEANAAATRNSQKPRSNCAQQGLRVQFRLEEECTGARKRRPEPSSFRVTNSFRQRGICLSLRQPHHLADEERSHRLLAAAILCHLLGVRRDHLVDHRLNRARVRDLLRLVALVDLGKVLALGRSMYPATASTSSR